jgi:glyoxylase-like metal-dependent hydrolase (beta-lactamase superfamily II)
MELVADVHRIEAEVGGRPLYLFAFLGERRLLLDAGCASTVDEFIIPFLDGLGLGLSDLDVLLITHSDLDHQGGAQLLKRANPSLWVTCGVLDIPLVSDPDALVADRYQAYAALHGIAPAEDAVAWMRQESGGAVRVDVGWSGGELLELGPDWSVRILHVPGHSVGHLAVYDERSGALFSADCLQGSVYLGLDGTPKLCPTYTHVDDYLATATLVESLAPRELHGCHWPAARGDEVAAFIAESRDYVAHVDGLVRTCLAEPLTLDALIACVNRRLDPPWPAEIAPELVYSIHGHAERLVALGAAARIRGADGRVVYQMSATT